MHRVASRQRLFSWDHFDATQQSSKTVEQEDDRDNIIHIADSIDANIGSTNSADDDLSDYRTCTSMSRPSSMLFHTTNSFGYGTYDHDISSHKNDEVYLVSDDEGEEKEIKDCVGSEISTETIALQKVTSFLSLNQDVQFAIMSFLDLNGLKALTLTCRHFNQVLNGCEVEAKDVSSYSDITYSSRNAIWWNLIQRTWPSLHLGLGGEKESSTFRAQKLVNFVVQNKNYHNRINYAALLSQAALSPPPTTTDPLFFKPTSIIEVETLHINEDAMIIRRRHRSRRKQTIYSTYELNVKLNDLKAPLRRHVKKYFMDKENEEAHKFEVVQYVGRVGVGDRSICSNQPFPRPLECLPAFKRTTNHSKSDESNNNESVFNLSCRGRKRSLPLHQEEIRGLSSVPLNFMEKLMSCSKNRSTLSAVVQTQPQHVTGSLFRSILSKSPHPFVSPTVINTNIPEKNSGFRRFIDIDLTPRTIAYFEVSILPREKSQEININEGNGDDNIPDHMANILDDVQLNVTNNEGESNSSCVAIGISKKGYSPSVRMPGWDQYSYGYHSDDGGIFHSKGDMIRVYGPRYDVGDTVGCGVNYQNGGIFFTLNGDFLGYAWCDEKDVLECKEDLFPTVGVDSSNPLALNFGNERPFMWDLPKFLTTNTA